MEHNLWGWWVVRWFDVDDEYHEMRFDDRKRAVAFEKDLRKQGCMVMK